MRKERKLELLKGQYQIRRMSEVAGVKRNANVQVRPHALSAEQLYTAYLGPHLQEATELLDAKLQSTQAENAKAMELIAAQRNEMERLVGDLEMLVHDVENSVQVMHEGTDNGIEGLRAEAWEMESEVKAVS